MEKLVIKPFNVVDKTVLPEMTVDHVLSDGDPLEISGEMYYVCEDVKKRKFNSSVLGVIPLVVRNPAKVTNIEKYIECLSIAHRKVLFKNKEGICDISNCDEMIIT
jgi:hypothetical protein